MKKVSEAYFLYKETYALQQSVDGDPFAEPVTVFNNIENGYGIFAGYRTTLYPLEVPSQNND